MVRRLALLAAVAIVAVVAPTPPARGNAFPDRIELRDDSNPEGIDIAGTTFFVGSITSGTVYAGDIRTGDVDELVPPHPGRAAIGLDEADGLIWVAGGPTGAAYVYDAETGADVDDFQLTTATATFVNDVVVTDDAAFFTDSRQPVLHRVDTASGAVSSVPLTGDYVHLAAPAFNLNGIDATPNGDTLLAVQTSNGHLYAIDADTGVATRVDLGGATLVGGDGVLLVGRTLYVVQNCSNQIAVVSLSGDLLSGEVVDTITDDDFDVPTTIARHGRNLYAVNARFGTTDPPPVDYWVAVVPR